MDIVILVLNILILLILIPLAIYCLSVTLMIDHISKQKNSKIDTIGKNVVKK